MHPIPSWRYIAAAVILGGGAGVGGLGLAACYNLGDTSPIPDGGGTDLDAGFVPVVDDGGSATGTTTVDSGPPPPSGRVRLANLLQNSPAVDLCARGDFSGAQWQPQLVTKPGGLNYGEVSAHNFVSVPTSAGSKYQYRIVPFGADCDSDAGGGPLVSIASGTNTLLKQGGSMTLAVVGDANAQANTEASPKGVVATDVLAPPAAVALLRVLHGVSDLAAFDVEINGDTALQGVKYASVLSYPYSSPTGFASLAGGVPQNATLTLKAGTTARNFTVANRVRRGVASTIFAYGRVDGAPGLVLSLCADREPAEGSVLSDCTPLAEAK